MKKKGAERRECEWQEDKRRGKEGLKALTGRINAHSVSEGTRLTVNFCPFLSYRTTVLLCSL